MIVVVIFLLFKTHKQFPAIHNSAQKSFFTLCHFVDKVTAVQYVRLSIHSYWKAIIKKQFNLEAEANNGGGAAGESKKKWNIILSLVRTWFLSETPLFINYYILTQRWLWNDISVHS